MQGFLLRNTWMVWWEPTPPRTSHEVGNNCRVFVHAHCRVLEHHLVYRCQAFTTLFLGIPWPTLCNPHHWSCVLQLLPIQRKNEHSQLLWFSKVRARSNDHYQNIHLAVDWLDFTVSHGKNYTHSSTSKSENYILYLVGWLPPEKLQ